VQRLLLWLSVSLLLSSCKTAGRSKLEGATTQDSGRFALVGCKSENSGKWAEQSSSVCKGPPFRLCYVGSRDNVIKYITSKHVILQDDYQLKLPQKGMGKLLDFQLWDSNGFKEKHVSMPPCLGETRVAVLNSVKGHSPEDSGPVDEESTDYSGIKCKDDSGRGALKAIEDIHCEAPGNGGVLCFSGEISDVIQSINKGGVTLGDDMVLKGARINSKNAQEISTSVWDMPNEEEFERVSIKSCR